MIPSTVVRSGALKYMDLVNNTNRLTSTVYEILSILLSCCPYPQGSASTRGAAGGGGAVCQVCCAGTYKASGLSVMESQT